MIRCKRCGRWILARKMDEHIDEHVRAFAIEGCCMAHTTED